MMTANGDARIVLPAPGIAAGMPRHHVLIFAGLLVLLLLAPFVLYPVFVMDVLCFGLFASALNLLLGSGVGQASRGPMLLAARILGWTPFAAGFVAPYDIADGRPLLAVTRLALVAVTVLLLLWWWSHTLESAMLGGSSEGLAGKAVRGGAVAALLPRAVRGAPPGVFTAVLARELRYWSRDPRRRSGLISILGAVDAVRAAQIETAKYANFTPYVVAGVLFVLITIPLTRFTDWLARRSGWLAAQGGLPGAAIR